MPFLGSRNFFLALVLESGRKVMQNRKLKPSRVKFKLKTVYGVYFEFEVSQRYFVVLVHVSFLLKMRMPYAM